MIEDLLGRVEAGESPVVVVCGEPGIGKSSLIHEALSRGERRGFETLSGRAAEYEQHVPFAVLADALADIEMPPTAGDAAMLREIFPTTGTTMGRSPQPVLGGER